jgi:uncharacterized RDD family membrane protein YckC
MGSPFATATSDNPYQSPESVEIWPAASGHLKQRLPLASRWTRLGGAIVDGLAHFVGMVPGFVLMIAADTDSSEEMEAIALLLMLGGLTVVAIVNWVLIAQRGQSYGKILLKMQIIRYDTGVLPGFVNGVILRIWIPVAINQFCSLFGLLDALWIFGQERRCLHDLIASTEVVDVSGTGSPFRRF